MVNSILRITFVGLALHAMPAFAVTADELRALSEEKAREQMQKKGRVNSGELGELVPMGTPKSGKYTNGLTPEPTSALPARAAAPNAAKEPASSVAKEGESPRGAERKQVSPAVRVPAGVSTGSNLYTPPPRELAGETTATGITSDAVAPSNAFGVRLGT